MKQQYCHHLDTNRKKVECLDLAWLINNLIFFSGSQTRRGHEEGVLYHTKNAPSTGKKDGKEFLVFNYYLTILAEIIIMYLCEQLTLMPKNNFRTCVYFNLPLVSDCLAAKLGEEMCSMSEAELKSWTSPTEIWQVCKQWS